MNLIRASHGMKVRPTRNSADQTPVLANV
jgi:hypothetical protein